MTESDLRLTVNQKGRKGLGKPEILENGKSSSVCFTDLGLLCFLSDSGSARKPERLLQMEKQP